MLSGTVRDASGAVIANAKVTVTSEQTSETRTAISNSQGDYRIDAVNSGTYSIHVDAPDFQSLDIKGLKVNPSVVTSYDPTLRVGSTVSTVEVEASTNNINTDNAQLSGTIDNSQLRTVPVFSLNPVELATTVPGVQLVDTKIDAGYSNGVNIQVNGARPRANSFLIDGADINDVSIGGQAILVQIPDIMESETVLTNAYSAEYGGAGGAVVNMITRSGSNKLHGSAWELYSGSGLNALDGQQRQATNYNKNRYNQHQYGFSLGGPILRDKLFFFGSAQWTRY
jgi:outer membrane receptor for ferrienterochelin and colicin